MHSSESSVRAAPAWVLQRGLDLLCIPFPCPLLLRAEPVTKAQAEAIVLWFGATPFGYRAASLGMGRDAEART
ncbi:hypothetical protein GCM10028864_58350 [Microlunatus parietis]